MQSSSHSHPYKYSEIFFQDQYEKVLRLTGSKTQSQRPSMIQENHANDLNQSKMQLRTRNHKNFELQFEKQCSLPVKIQEQEFDDDQSPSQFKFIQNDNQSDDSSDQFSESIDLIDSQQSKPPTKKKQNNEKQIKKKLNQINNQKKTKTVTKSCNNNKIGQRKIRTTVSQQKIKILEHIFPYIEQKIAYKGTVINLKDVSKIVNLGYSTILHKYKDYRKKGKVQKGLLLKCKDVKRKYNKSLVIENYIKNALKEKNFKTAKQLAMYLSQKHKIKLNRSIISRHLNEMQREKKCEYIGGIINEDSNDESENKASFMLKQFSKIFLGLKSQRIDFFYMTVIRMYLIDGKLVKQIQNTQAKVKIINLVITATQNQLCFYYPIIPLNGQKVSSKKYSQLIKHSAFQALYQELSVRIEEKHMQVQNNNKKVYVVFPYENKHKEFLYRQKVLEKLLQEKINVLVMPPILNQDNANFIRKWFFKNVFKKVNKVEFNGVEECKQQIMRIMNEQQNNLSDYVGEMISLIKKFQ